MSSRIEKITVLGLGLVVLAYGGARWITSHNDEVIKVRPTTLDKVEVTALTDQARAEAGRVAAAEYVNRLEGVKNAEAVYLDHPAENSFAYRVVSDGADGKAPFTKRVVMDVKFGPESSNVSDEEKMKNPLRLTFTVTDVTAQ